MTGNTKVWRAPLAGLASFAMIATMGLAAGTANAAFKPTDGGEYTVTVNLNGGKFTAPLTAPAGDANVKITYNVDNEATKSDVATVENVNANTELNKIVPAAVAAPDTNYYFTGWYGQQAVGAQAVNTASADTKVTGNVDLFAHYASGSKTPAESNAVTVSFNTGSTDVKLAAGDKLADWQLPAQNPDTDPNQISGWALTSNGEKLDLSTYVFAKDTQLFPKFDHVQVTYVNKNNTTAVKYAPKSAKFTKADPTAYGWAGTDWYELKDGVTKYEDDSSLKDTAFDFDKGTDKDVTLYGKTTAPLTGTVTYYYPSAKDDNDGYGTATEYGKDDAVANGSRLTLPAAPADNTKLGRPFLYWSQTAPTAADPLPTRYNESTYVSVTAAGNAGDPNTVSVPALYAVFGDATKGTYKATFDENYNGKRTTINAADDNTVTAPTPGERSGYTFKGWAQGNPSESTNSNNLFDADETISLSADATFYAVWEGNDPLDAVKTKLSNSKTVNNEAGEKVRPYEEKSYAAYVKVYSKYFNNGILKNGVDQDEAIKAVSEAKSAIVETPTSNLYRAYNLNNGDHYFVADKGAQDDLVQLGWKAEGAPFKVVKATGRSSKDNPTQPALGTAIYSVYNPNTGEHLLVQEFEADALAKAGWNKEDIQFYVPQNAGTKDVYRVYNPNTNGPAHVYVSKGEATGLVAQGWRWDFGGKVAFKLS